MEGYGKLKAMVLSDLSLNSSIFVSSLNHRPGFLKLLNLTVFWLTTLDESGKNMTSGTKYVNINIFTGLKENDFDRTN